MSADQKVAVITGASQGIGAALVRAYRDRNYRVVGLARSMQPSTDDNIHAVSGDIADRRTAMAVQRYQMISSRRLSMPARAAR